MLFTKNIKTIFIDLDGTLLDVYKDAMNDNTISEENLNAMKKINKKGVQTIVSTGRSFIYSKKILELINAKYAVLSNGAQIYKKGKIVKEYNLEIRHILLIINFAKKHKLLLRFNSDNKSYGHKSLILNTIFKKYNFKIQNHYNIDLKRNFQKIVIFGKSKWKIRKIQKLLFQKFKDLSVTLASKDWVVEITTKQATKGLGNLYVAQKFLKIKDPKTLIHIGDDMNDASTISYMRCIAMKNANKKLKKITKYQGPHFKKGGVAKILNSI